MTRFIQNDITDCGPACLKYVAHHYGLALTNARLRLEMGTNEQGTSILGLVEGARKNGFISKGVRAEAESLAKLPLPAIAHVQPVQGFFHFVVLVKVGPKSVKVMDPTDGLMRKMPIGEFLRQWTHLAILLVPGELFKPLKTESSCFSIYSKLAAPYKAELFQLFIAAIITTALALTGSLYVGKIIDAVIPESNFALLNVLGSAMICIALFKHVLGIIQARLSMRVGQELGAKMLLGFYEHLVHLPQRFYDSIKVGEIVSRLIDLVTIRTFITQGILSLFLNTCLLIVVLLLLFLFGTKIAILSLGLLGAYSILYFIVNRVNRFFQRQMVEKGTEFQGHLVETLGNVAAIRQFQLQALECSKMESRVVDIFKLGWRSGNVNLLLGTSASLMSQVYTIVLLWVGSYYVLRSAMTPGELMSSYALSGFLIGPINALVGMNQMLQACLIATQRVFDILGLDRESDVGKLVCGAEAGGDIVFEKVCFKHSGRSATLHDVSFTIPRGSITLLEGESGCGKTTTLNLLQRIYSQDSGEIRIGGVDIRQFTIESYRSCIGVVNQNVELFSGSIVENIALGEEKPDVVRIEKICADLLLLDFFRSLPNQLSTQLNEHAMNMSGGQRQRIALARAIYRSPKVLLLDEPASSLDAESEEALVSILKRLRAGGVTIVAVAHHGHIREVADCRIKMQGGRVASVEYALQGAREKAYELSASV